MAEANKLEGEDTVDGAEAEDALPGAGDDTVAGAEDTVAGAEDTVAGDDTVAGAAQDTIAGSAEGDVVVQIGDAKPAAEEKAPEWVREVRKRNRELEKQNRELQRKIEGNTQAAQAGKEPEMSDPDVDYDADKFKAKYAEWMEKKRKADEESEKLVQQQQKDQQAWQGRLDSYGQAKAALKVPDFDDAESIVQETLTERQQAIILKGSKNPALMIYALGKNPAKAKELAAVTDLVEFAFAVANLETQLKITTRKPSPPAPERKVEGAGPKSGAVDSTLDRLRAEAEKTGDYSKVHAHKKKKAA